MKRMLGAMILGTLALCAGAGASRADPGDCRKAVEAYDVALDRLLDATRQHEACAAASHGHDKCEATFDSLDSAQDAFDSAVSDYRDQCPRGR